MRYVTATNVIKAEPLRTDAHNRGGDCVAEVIITQTDYPVAPNYRVYSRCEPITLIFHAIHSINIPNDHKFAIVCVTIAMQTMGDLKIQLRINGMAFAGCQFLKVSPSFIHIQIIAHSCARVHYLCGRILFIHEIQRNEFINSTIY